MLLNHVVKVYALGYLLIALSFTVNIFGVGPNIDWFSNFQRDSESIVTKTVDCQNSSDRLDYAGPIRAKDLNYGPGCSPRQYVPYESQFGLQSRLIAFFAPADEGLRRYYYLAVMSALALALAAVMLALVYFIHREFGGLVGATVLGLVCISDWLVAYAHNMYWVTFVMFLPLVYSFGFYRIFKVRRQLPLFYSLLGILFLLKFLDGYEHATTLTVSALVPIVYFEYKDGLRRFWELWRQGVGVLGASIVAFVIALGLHVSSLHEYYRSWPQAVAIVAGRAEERSDPLQMRSYVIGGFAYTQPVVYERINRLYNLDAMRDGKAHPVKYMLLSALNYALLPAVSVPIVIRDPLGVILQSVLVVGLLAGLALHRSKAVRLLGVNKVRALKSSYWLGLIGAVSWLMLMPGHAYVHAHLNAIVFYMPYLLICYIVFGVVLSVWFRRRIMTI